jgi:hypothetical protein
MERQGTTPRDDARKQLREATKRAVTATDPKEVAKAVDDAAKAILKGLRPNAPYAD